MSRKITAVIVIILVLLPGIYFMTGCSEDEGSPTILAINFDPESPVEPNTDVHITAEVEGSNLTYYWSVTDGIVREINHSAQGDDLSIAVTDADLDDMGDVLDGLGFEYETIDHETLGNPIAIADYDAIYINSSDDISVVTSDLAIRSWVQAGGSLYASGKACEYMTYLWPEIVTFAEPDPYVGKPNTTSDWMDAEILSDSAAFNLGFDELILTYPEYAWPPIVDVDISTSIIVRADASSVVATELITNLPFGEDFDRMPSAVSFEYGDGFVLYTNHHLTSGMDIEERDLLDYLATVVLVQPLTQLAHTLLDMAGYFPYADYVGIVEEDVEMELEFDIEGIDDIYVVINGLDGSFDVTVEGPGDAFKEASGSIPMSMAFPSIEDGTWTVTFTATDTKGIDNMPYVIAIGERSESGDLVTTVPEVIWRTPFAPGTYAVTLKVQDEQFRGDQWAVGIEVE